MLVAVSCKDPEPPVKVVPQFPSLVQDNAVAPGSVLTLSFEANADWTVSVPTDNLQWFWIKDGSFKVDKVSGKVTPGEKTSVIVQIGVSETEEFDTNRSCDVTLSMGGESKVIAKYMRPAKERAMAVYVAKVENGTFVMDGEAYVYEPAQAASALLWSEEDKEFRLPVRVESNCSWTMELPEWAEANVPESTVGVVEIVLTGASLDDASGMVTFKDGDEVLKEVEVTVPSCREMAVYAVQLDENGEFMFEEGGYLYTEEPVKEVTLVWPGADFRLPVKVDAKCEWYVEGPEWLQISLTESTVGVTEFNLQGVPSKYPLEETSDVLKFCFKGETIYEMTVTIPASKTLSRYSLDMSLTELAFSYKGNVKTSTGFSSAAATGHIFGPSTVDFYAVEMVNGKPSGNAPAWLKIEITAYDLSKDADLLQSRAFSVTVQENATDEDRYAYLFFNRGYDWPSSVSDLFDASGEVKKEYAEYAVPVLQYGNNMPYITMSYSAEDMAIAGAKFDNLTGSKMKLLQKYFGETSHVYTLTYNNIYARDNAHMFFAVPYSSYKIFDSSRNDKTEDEKFWIRFAEFSETLTYGAVEMYADEEVEAPSAATTGYVVFYDADQNPLAIVETVYDPSKVIGDSAKIEFIGESAMYAEMVGATLVEVTEGSLFDQYKEYGAPIYHLTYRMMGMPMRISIPSNAVMYTPNPYMKRNIFRVNNLNYDETVGRFELLEGGVDIYMVLDEGSSSTYERGNILFYNSDNTVVLALVCTLDLNY